MKPSGRVMNWKHSIGSTYYSAVRAILSSSYFPLTRYFPSGVSWLFDVQRFMVLILLGVVFDAGANTGQTVQDILRHAPKAEIYTFEPASNTFQILSEKFDNLKNVHCFNVALGADLINSCSPVAKYSIENTSGFKLVIAASPKPNANGRCHNSRQHRRLPWALVLGHFKNGCPRVGNGSDERRSELDCEPECDVRVL